MKVIQRAISIIEYIFGRAPRRMPMSLSPDAELYQDQDGRWQGPQLRCRLELIKRYFLAIIPFRVQAEFGDVTAYLAFKKADLAGLMKICSGHGVVVFSSSAPAPKEEWISDKKFCFSGARTSEEIRRDELRQYQKGVPCHSPNSVMSNPISNSKVKLLCRLWKTTS